jgi:hypothetical protein
LEVIDAGVVFPIPEIVFFDLPLPRVEPFTNKCEQFRFIIPFWLLKTVECLPRGV